MRRVDLSDPPGVRWVPDAPTGVGVLVLGGSSGRVEADRARVVAGRGCLAESVRWFGGPGQQPGTWEVPLELFGRRVEGLRRDCDRVVVVGLSFGAEAALVTASELGGVDAVVALAPSDVVWAGVAPGPRQTSHWTLGGEPLPFVPVDDRWEPADDPPSFAPMYEASRRRYPREAEAAAIAVERVPEVVCVAGGDDRVWPSVEHAERIRERRRSHGAATVVVTDAGAGHRAILPGEAVPSGGTTMRRGGTEAADLLFGAAAWVELTRVLGVSGRAGRGRPPGGRER